MSTIFRNLRVAARSFRRRPGFALPAIVILGIGIGATTTMFSVADTVLFRRLPYPEPGELVFVERGNHSPPEFMDWRDGFASFATMGAAWTDRIALLGGERAEQLRVARVTPDFLAMLGAAPHLGRLFAPDEFSGEPSVVLLDYGLWQRRWGGDPSIVGQSITLDGSPFVVVGIVSPRFQPPNALTGSNVDVWLPLDVEWANVHGRGYTILRVVGRLRDGVTFGAAQAEMDAYVRSVASENPGRYLRRDGSPNRFPLLPLHIATIREVAQPLVVLLGAVGLMLLIACANVANLFLAQGTVRAREIAVRGALGASRRKIFGQLLTESVALAGIGGVLGVWLALIGVEAFTRLSPVSVPRLENVTVDARVLVFALIASVGTGVICGILPALQAARRNTIDVLREGASGLTSTRKGRRVRGSLVVAEIALALLLLTGAGLMFRSLMGMMRVDSGFETENLITFPLNLTGSYTQERRNQFVDELLERIALIPGTRVASAAWTVPFQYTGGSRCCWSTRVSNVLASENVPPVSSFIHPIAPGYFDALAVQLLYGRDFTRQDDAANGWVAIINQRTALYLFGTENAVGRRLRFAGGEDVLTVVGVVPAVKHWGALREDEFAVYLPYHKFGSSAEIFHAVVRTDDDPGRHAAALRQAVWSIDPNLPVEGMSTMRERVDTSLAGPRFLSLLFTTFATIAVVLACGGIYASMLHWVGLRRQEMGIRLALGAESRRVAGYVLLHGMILTLVGVALGLGSAYGLSRLLRGLIWGIAETDVPTYAAAALLLGATALAACWLPAWRAGQTDPMETLRSE
jgi:putative ABC transport system permease protein